MVQCELCGAETGSPTSIKIEGAELDVCDSCASLGSEVRQGRDEPTTTKYSTDSSSTPSSPGGTTRSRQRGGRSRRDDDVFDSLGDLAQDYDERIRLAREERNLSQAELADELNEKASVIRRLERGETLPNDEIQAKLERYLDIDLSGGSVDTAEWSSEEAGQSFTLGEIAERKD
ncbi:MAG: multiprotein bridging factor aMBF1 [Halobacteriales archaeon]